MPDLEDTNVILRNYGTNEFENKSVERDVEMGLQSKEPHQSRNLNVEELGTLTNSLSKSSQADLLSNGRKKAEIPQADLLSNGRKKAEIRT